MKRQALVKKIREAANDAEVEWVMARQGKEHEIWQCGQTRVSIPRHSEIKEPLAQRICRDLDEELGKDWWR